MPETHHTLKSARLGNERGIWIIPPRDPSAPARLAVFLDAERYRDPAPRVDVLPVLDELVAGGALANTLFVFVSEHDAEARWRECPCHPPFADFINEELLPWLENLHPESRVAPARVLIGLSYTGLAAAYVAFRAPGRWTHVISQSGSHWSDDEWLTARYRELSTPLPTRFYLDVGRGETAENVRHREDVLQVASQIDAVRRFRDALRATGHEVNDHEYDGGHDYSAWRKTLPAALRWALPASHVPASLFPPRFATTRLTLAPITAADRDTIFHGWASDPVATHYLTFPTATSPADVEGFLERVARGWVDQTAFNWLITEAATREAIGAVTARVQGHKVEFGYVLRVSSWGRGYMTEVLRELVRLSFEIPSIHRVGAVCDVDNPASARVMEKAGLAREGLLRAWTRHPNAGPHPRDCWSHSLRRAAPAETRSPL